LAAICRRWKLSGEEIRRSVWLAVHVDRVRQAAQIPWPELQRLLVAEDSPALVLHAGGDVNIPAYVQAMLEQTAEKLESLHRAVAHSEENQAAVHHGLVSLTERLTALGDQIATEQALLGRLISSQEELRPVLARLGEGHTGGIDEATRNHIRNMDVYLARLLDETVQGRSQMTQELRSEIKMVARTIAAAAGEPRVLSG
jgi:hypothetical protein